MFNVKNIKDVKDLLDQNLNYNLESEKINTLQSLERVVSKDIFSTEDVPSFNKSTVDGYACLYEDISQASENSPVALKLVGEVDMGKTIDIELNPGETIYVPTGGFIPNGATVMVMIEHTEKISNDILIHKSSSMYQHIIRIGQDIKKGELLIYKNTTINPRIIGALMSQNIKEVEVYKQLEFSVISTGDEITDKEEIKLGEVRDINTYTISSYIESKNHKIVKTSIINDDKELYKKEILDSFETSDIIISSGGSSVGEKDYTITILKELGANILLHGLNIKPGKPTILAIYKDKLFIGLPGHPLSAYIVLEMLFGKLISSIYKKHELPKRYIECKISENIHNPSGRTLIQLVDVESDVAYPLHFKSAMINVLKDAYGYIVIDERSEGVYKDDLIKVYKLGD